MEQVTIEGRRFHSQRLEASDGKLCQFDGELDYSNRVYRGTATCPGGPSGWAWSLELPNASAPLIRAAPPAAETRAWQYQSAGDWNGTWTKRGTSDVYDSSLQGRYERQTIVERVTFEGNRVHAQRIQSPDGKLCTLDGALHSDGRTYVGTAECPGGPSGWVWRITPAGLPFPPW